MFIFNFYDHENITNLLLYKDDFGLLKANNESKWNAINRMVNQYYIRCSVVQIWWHSLWFLVSTSFEHRRTFMYWNNNKIYSYVIRFNIHFTTKEIQLLFVVDNGWLTCSWNFEKNTWWCVFWTMLQTFPFIRDTQKFQQITCWSMMKLVVQVNRKRWTQYHAKWFANRFRQRTICYL